MNSESNPEIFADADDATPGPQFSRSDADAGHPEAQFGLGLRYAVAGVTPDYTQAAEWYRKAAEQNHHLAQFNLGQMFAHGHGVPPDDAAAVMWIRRAADGGDAGAQFNLGNRAYRESMKITESHAAESRIEAYKWYRLAAAQGYGTSQNSCDVVTMSMSREEVQEGNERAAAFVAQHHC
jgi:uncharacterized protein